MEPQVDVAGETDRIIQAELRVIAEKVPCMDHMKLVTCVSALVAVSIMKTQHKQLIVRIQFPKNYPHTPLLIELTSKTLSVKLLDGLQKVCEEEAKKLIGQRQVLSVLKFVHTFLEENPLSVCSNEISYIKRELLTDSDEIKLKQKTSHIILKVFQDEYFLHIKITVPDIYPLKQIDIEILDHNFPESLKLNFLAQAIENARQCVQPPLKRSPKDSPFEPKCSLLPVCKFLISSCVKPYPTEKCPLCKEQVLPKNPKSPITDPRKQIERVYCGHLFHHGCLNVYMKTPPFTGGKKCPSCGKQIFHEKWKISPQLAEARWAHKQARTRELDEVKEFLE